MNPEEFTALCKAFEHFETPEWAAAAILEKEILTHRVIDPCCGSGILSVAARAKNYNVDAIDINDWGFKNTWVTDFLNPEQEFIDLCQYLKNEQPFSVFMNPPFSVAEKFVEQSFRLGARKIVCFQRFSWYEGSYDRGKKRGQWWEKFPPSRIYICGDRASCWRHDIPQDVRDESAGTPTAHAWFVWEPAHPKGTIIGTIYK